VEAVEPGLDEGVRQVGIADFAGGFEVVRGELIFAGAVAALADV
jgi:hypothetical protein